MTAMERPFERDTDPDSRRVLVEGIRRMSPAQKLARVTALNRSVEMLALAGIRMRHPDASEHEVHRLLARMWLDEDTLAAVTSRRSPDG